MKTANLSSNVISFPPPLSLYHLLTHLLTHSLAYCVFSIYNLIHILPVTLAFI